MTYEILSNQQMVEADRKTIAGGVAGYDLMCRAGLAVVDVIEERFDPAPVLVLCGPGNNGGDGFVIARLLQERGYDVACSCFVPRETLQGDAAKAAEDWTGKVISFQYLSVQPEHLVVDAVFGTGLGRAIEEPVVSVFAQVKAAGCTVVAVDIPSGVHGSSGEADPHTLTADVTVSFHRKKLGHVLLPGMAYCGAVIVRDIGITDDFEYSAVENQPGIWCDLIPKRKIEAHKYNYGHALIYGAPELTGATRLAAEACARIGAGLVTVLAPEKVANVYRETLKAHVMVREDLDWQDDRVSARLYGSGGLSVKPDFKSDIPTVLDADALRDLTDKLSENYVLTPHEGEFARAFPDLEGSKLEKAKQAAARIGAIIVLKGADTVIAHPDGRVVVNIHSDPALATAGTGDVLAGMITGLLAQGMPAYEAVCAAVWIHGACGKRIGVGLVASDLPDLIPSILADIT